MKKRGRQSGNDTTSNIIELRPTPKPPSHLTAEQAEVWRMVVESRAGDLVAPEAYPVLIEYCRTVVSANKVASQVDAFKSEWVTTVDGLKRWDKLLAMQDRLAGKVASLAVKLRLTPSTRWQPASAAAITNKGIKRKPWDESQ